MIITLIGSTKFKKEYELYNVALTLSGHIVLSCAVFGSFEEKINVDRLDKAVLDIVHFKKIDISDAVLLLNKNGYIGESTERELQYVRYHNNKEIKIFAIERDNNESEEQDFSWWSNINNILKKGMLEKAKQYLNYKE